VGFDKTQEIEVTGCIEINLFHFLKPKKSNTVRAWLYFVVCLLGINSLQAAHIVGGELYYDYLGNNQYQITLIVYRDCESSTEFDQDASLGVFETATGDFYDSYNMSLDDAEVTDMPPILENPCNLLPPQVCIEKAVYTLTINLPPIAGGYTLSYQRCCRPNGIDNLLFDQQGSTLTTTIPDAEDIGGTNSSPRFTEMPPVSLCQGAAFFFDHGATDPDGDELVYSFCAPLNGATADAPMPNPPSGPPYQSVTYANGFDPTNPINGAPPFTIDPQTGFITGTATAIGVYSVAVCVSEYRNGVLVSTVSRDFQYRVIFCASSEADFPTLENSSYESCSGLAVNFDNTSSASANTTYHWDFGVPGIDNDTSNVFEPSFTYPGPGSYTITLTANPGWPCEDQVIHEYIVHPPVIPTLTVGEYQCIELHDTYDFTVTGDYSNLADIAWNFGPGAVPASSTNDNPANVEFPSSSNSWTITVQVEDNGCIGTDTETIVNAPDPIASIQPQDVFCSGLVYEFESSSLNASSHIWDFDGLGTEDLSNVLNPTFEYITGGSYDVQLIVTADNACNDTSVVTFDIAESPQPYFEPQPAQCLQNNSFDFEAQGATTLNPQYTWSFGPSASLVSSSQAQPSGITFDSPGYHDVTLTISESGCTASYTDSVGVALNILPDFQIDNTVGCPGLVAQVVAVTESVVPVNYIWDFGNGVVSSQGVTVQTYDMPGTYSITATAFTNEGCYDSLTITFPNAVTIYPNPDPSFTIDPQVMDITEAETHITSLYQEGNCQYFMSDGGEINDCEFDYSWTASGVQTITHYVTSPQGCTSSTTGEVIIQGFTFYAPTAFTPNADGINDFWLPVMTGVVEFEMNIYNRWGDLIYSSDHLTRPWSGQVDNGQHYAPNGVYQYRITISDLLLKRHEFSGVFSLFR
jgi:gliding motility-associated-like protein